MKRPLSTNYEGHDALYQNKRLNGEDGWDTEAVSKENIAALERLMAKCLLPAAGKMIELGCGAGNLTSYFAQHGWQAVGVDISQTAIAWARDRASKLGLSIDFQQANVLSPPTFDEATFDLAFDGHCFHCIIGDDRKRFLEQAHRLLKPGGHLLIMTMSGDYPTLPTRQHLGHFDPESRCQIIDGAAIRYIGDADEILEEVRAAGFRIAYSTVEARKTESDIDHLLIAATSKDPSYIEGSNINPTHR